MYFKITPTGSALSSFKFHRNNETYLGCRIRYAYCSNILFSTNGMLAIQLILLVHDN